jgi:hypothetical protein
LINDIIDDIRIFIVIEEIDGQFGTLAQAGPCLTRGLSKLPLLGTITFDSADLTFLENTGDMEEVVAHEMGHVLGLGTLWGPTFFDLRRNPSVPSSPGADTHFIGPLAIEAFDNAGGTTYTGGAKVPVENSATEGSADGHWREAVLDFELMTPIINSGSTNPLSAISIQSLADIGYRVDPSKADVINWLFTRPAPASPLLPGIDLSNDIRKGPRFVVGAKGGITRVIER